MTNNYASAMINLPSPLPELWQKSLTAPRGSKNRTMVELKFAMTQQLQKENEAKRVLVPMCQK